MSQQKNPLYTQNELPNTRILLGQLLLQYLFIYIKKVFPMARTKMTDSEKSEVAAVRDYLKALEQNAPRRGRKRTAESIGRQLATLGGEMAEATVTRRLSLIQQRIDLEADLEAISQATSVDLTALEAGFATYAAAYGGRRGISHAAWREIGVSSATLKSAGIRRSA
jgi:hypothetical protein